MRNVQNLMFYHFFLWREKFFIKRAKIGKVSVCFGPSLSPYYDSQEIFIFTGETAARHAKGSKLAIHPAVTTTNKNCAMKQSICVCTEEGRSVQQALWMARAYEEHRMEHWCMLLSISNSSVPNSTNRSLQRRVSELEKRSSKRSKSPRASATACLASATERNKRQRQGKGAKGKDKAQPKAQPQGQPFWNFTTILKIG